MGNADNRSLSTGKILSFSFPLLFTEPVPARREMENIKP
jgi:hypothetical protein